MKKVHNCHKECNLETKAISFLFEKLQSEFFSPKVADVAEEISIVVWLIS